jgi:Flp pilus assembly protein protease CpaA
LGGSIIVFSNIPAQYFPLFVGFLLMYTFFQAGIMGGADSLAAIYMLLWFPSWGMLGTLLWGMLIIASVILYKKYKKQSLIKIIQTVKSGDEGTKSPTMIGFSFGSASYFAIILIFSLLGPIS